MNERSRQPISEEMVVAALTSEGHFPVELCFLLGKAIYRWHPTSPLWQGLLIDNPELADACRSFLVSKGRKFITRDELGVWAREHNWPHWERLQPVKAESEHQK